MSAGSGGAAVVGAVASEPRLDASRGTAAPPGSEAAAATDFWSLLVNAQTSDQLCRAWLGILCQWIPGTQAGLLLLNEQGDRYAPAAVWPDPERDMSFLAGVAQEALVERRGAMLHESNGLAQCAYPLLGAQQTYGVVVLHVVARGDAGMREALRLLHWGAGWLVGLFDRRHLVDRDVRLNRSALLQDLMIGAMAEGAPEQALRWVVNRLAEGLPCRTVMLGRPSGDGITLQSVSGSASFDARSNLLTAAREAMHDAVELRQPQLAPRPAGPDGAPPPAIESTSTADYLRESGAKAAMVLPLLHGGQGVGALLIDFAEAPPPGTFEFAQTLALALAPCLALQRAARRGLAEHAAERWHDACATIAGPRRPGLKLAAGLVAIALLAAAWLPVDYRVRAPATVEGRVQRAAVAPFAGFIAEAKARAGDTVRAGDVLARLDDRELKLEQVKWSSQVELADRKLREAMARGDAVTVRLAQADVAQAQAELSLVDERLARAALVAPFDGVVVRGDLSQQLGAPVEQGKLLFEVAPLDAYRVVLRVDERDVAQLKRGAEGELLLAGLTGRPFPIRVTQVAPVATAENGANAFRVEAEVQGAAPTLQPGMEGVGKVTAGERSLLWIATHRVVDWVRYTAWSWGL